MWSIDIRGANVPPKFAKVLADQEYGYESGLGDMTIPIKAVKRSDFGMNPEHRRRFIEKTDSEVEQLIIYPTPSQIEIFQTHDIEFVEFVIKS